MTVRAKFIVAEKTESAGDGFQVKLLPVTGGSPENEAFYKWTPGGQILLGTINKAAADAFVPGAAYYVDFTPAE